MQMNYDNQYYKGLLIQGKLHEAVDYLRQFPKKSTLVKRIEKRFAQGSILKRSDNEFICKMDSIYQEYYHNVFWKNENQEDCTKKLYDQLIPYVGEPALKKKLNEVYGEQAEELYKDYTYRVGYIEELMGSMYESEGYHFMGGITQGYFGPYIWKTTTKQEYQVELPNKIQKFNVNMMEDFVVGGWLDYISLGMAGTGGWQDEKGLFCIKKRYQKDFEKPEFLVSYLKHEAQHDYDMVEYQEKDSVTLEYRAKLVELIYYPNIQCFKKFLMSANDENKKNSHAYASYLIVKRLSELIFHEDYVSDYSRWQRKLKKIQQYSRVCYDECYQ